MRALVVFSVIARVPLGITAISLVLFVQQQTGSFAVAGATTATYAFSSAVLGVWMSRLIDLRGQTVVLLAGMVVYVAAIGMLVVLGLSGAPAGALLPCAVAAGAQPPVSTALRPLWPTLLGDRPALLPTAFALDALLIESVFVSGPLLTGLIIALFSPQVALFTGLVFLCVGTLGFAAGEPSRRWRGEQREAGGLIGALRSPGLRTLTFAAIGIGVCFGTIEVAFAAYAKAQHTSALAGVLIALQASGSALGGLWFGANAARLGPHHVAYVRLACAFPVLIALCAATEVLPVVIVMALISGAATAPLTTVQNLLAGELAPRGRVTESFTWLVTALVVGIACGNAAAGAIVDVASWRLAVVAAALISGTAAVVTVARRRTLAPV